MNKTIKKILYAGLILNIILAAFKLLFGYLGNSFSLKVDGINSLIDIFIGGLLLLSLNIASKKPDRNHPYGHEKYEVIVSLILGLFLIVTSFIIVFSSITSMDKDLEIKKYSLLVVGISIVLKSIVLYINVWGYKKYNQVSLKADAYNHFGDILATTASFFGILISIYTKFKYFDYLAAIIIAVIILINGIKVIKESISYLVDESPDKEFNDKVKNFINKIEGVIKIDDYKSRLHVNKVYIDVEIGVDKILSLIKAHEIAELVHKKVEDEFKEVIHCMVHVNPYYK